MPLTESDLAAIESAAEHDSLIERVETKSDNNYPGVWIESFRKDDPEPDWFFLSPKRIGAIAMWLRLGALLADLRVARQERDQAQEESRQLRTDLANALLAHLIKNLNEMDEVPRFAFRATPNAQLFRKWLESAATHETPCEDCPTTPVQHCCNWQVDATEQEEK